MKYNPPYVPGGNPDPNASYVDRDVPNATVGSKVPRKAIEDPQREIVQVLLDRGIVPDAGDLGQLSKAIGYGRRRLTANTSFYVNGTTGSDSNDGSIGAPWATLAKAATYLSTTLDLAGFTVTVNVADGTYSQGFSLSSPLVGQAGVASVQVVGNVASPTACFTNSPSVGCFVASRGAAFQVRGFQVAATSSVAQNGSGLYASSGAVIAYDSMAFNSCFNAHVFAELGGYCTSSGSNIINGNSPSHVFAKDGGTISIFGRAHTLSGGPTFSGAFAQAETGTIEAASATFSGSASGPRYYANANGVIKCAGGGANFFPGSVAGSVAQGGQYV